MARKVAQPGVDRRQQILEAALDVFAEQGFEAATTKEIARRVGVAQGLVYFYFSSKLDLMRAACDHQTKLALAHLDARQEEENHLPPDQALKHMIARFVITMSLPRTTNLLRILTGAEYPEPEIIAVDNDKNNQVTLLAERIFTELHTFLLKHVSSEEHVQGARVVATFTTSGLISTMIQRALGRDFQLAFSQDQLIQQVSEMLQAWLTSRTTHSS